MMTTEERKAFYQELGERIKKARKNAGLKQDDFANHLDISRVSIVNIEKGRQTPPIHLVWQMTKVLNVTLNDLFPDVLPTQPSSILDVIAAEPIPEYVSKEKLIRFLEGE